MKLTATEIVREINRLPREHTYNYINPKTPTKLVISSITLPEGPITIKRYNNTKGGNSAAAKPETISPQMIWRIANAFTPGCPINFERVLGASYNTRSALEALLAHTPEFYACWPGRIEVVGSTPKVKKGHKHLIWLPDKPHKPGIIETHETDIVISEIPTIDAVYEAVSLPDFSQDTAIDINIRRRHAQIQVALVKISEQLGYKSWVAQNDRSITYKDKKIAEFPNVLNSMNDIDFLKPFPEAVKAGLLIDCIWFKEGKSMPAVMEIEHSTGVTSGLTRMKKFYDLIPKLNGIKWIIVAPDEERAKVFREAKHQQFESLNIAFFAYTAVEELYSLCQRRTLTGIEDNFLNSFLEPCN